MSAAIFLLLGILLGYLFGLASKGPLWVKNTNVTHTTSWTTTNGSMEKGA